MSYLSIPPQQRLIIVDEAIGFAGVSTGTLIANAIYLYAFEVDVPTAFSGGKWRTGTTTTGTTALGIYTFAGALVGTDTGLVTNITASNMSANFSGGNITLAPGRYFMALTPSLSTDNYLQLASAATMPTSRCRIAVNNSDGTHGASAGLLTPTTGGYTDSPSKFPAFALTVVGGLT